MVVKCVNLTLVTRFIGFTCLIISVLLLTIGNDYDQSKFKVLALGLDWQHIFISTNATNEGKLVYATVAYYSSVQLITSAILIYATISCNRWCVIPWIIWALFSCISKLLRMVFHYNRMNAIYHLGSISHIAVMICCCIVVYSAQNSWKTKRVQFSFTIERRPSEEIIFENLETPEVSISNNNSRQHSPQWKSPKAYVPNLNYGEI